MSVILNQDISATRPLVFRYAPNSLNLFYAFDGNKNVSDEFYRLTANGIGAHYDYAPFGATTRTHRDSSASFDIVSLNPFRFSSEYYDSELDLVYYNYRHYSPSLGRFLSRDPIEEQGGLNLYAFLGNYMLLSVDMLGLSEWRRVHCQKISTGFGIGAYTGVGVSGGFDVSGEICDCCNTRTGKILLEDTWSVEVSVYGKVGFGAGGHLKIGGFSLSLDILGPQLDLIGISGGYEKKCGEDGHGFFRKEVSVDISLSGNIGKGIGVGGYIGIKFFGGFEVYFHNREWVSYKYYGSASKGAVNVDLIFGIYTYTWDWTEDKKQTEVRSGRF